MENFARVQPTDNMYMSQLLAVTQVWQDTYHYVNDLR